MTKNIPRERSQEKNGRRSRHFFFLSRAIAFVGMGGGGDEREEICEETIQILAKCRRIDRFLAFKCTISINFLVFENAYL